MIDECHAVHRLSVRHQHKGLGISVVVKAGASDGYLFAAAAVLSAEADFGPSWQIIQLRVRYIGPVVGASDDGETGAVHTLFGGVLDAGAGPDHHGQSLTDAGIAVVIIPWIHIWDLGGDYHHVLFHVLSRADLAAVINLNGCGIKSTSIASR